MKMKNNNQTRGGASRFFPLSPVALALTLSLFPAHSALATSVIPGEYRFEVRDPKTKEVYFTGEEKVSIEGEKARRETLYFDKEKKEVQKDTFNFDKNSLKADSFQSVNKLTGEESQIAPMDKGLELSYRAKTGEEPGKSVLPGDSFLANSAADLIVANWEKLMTGKAVRFSLVVPSRGEVIPFQLVRREAKTVEGEAQEVFTLMPQNILIRLLAPHLEFQFNRDKKIRQAVYPSSLPIDGSPGKMVEVIFARS